VSRALVYDHAHTHAWLKTQRLQWLITVEDKHSDADKLYFSQITD